MRFQEDKARFLGGGIFFVNDSLVRGALELLASHNSSVPCSLRRVIKFARLLRVAAR